INRVPPGVAGVNPYTPVAQVEQKRAMRALAKYVFAPNAVLGSKDLYAHLQTQRRGFDFMGQSEDPKLHSAWGGTQTAVLDRLLHPVVLRRITDSRLYGNEYSVAGMMVDLTAAVFDADTSNVNTVRQNLQIEYIKRLAAIAAPTGSEVDNVARSSAIYQLNKVSDMMGNKRRRSNVETQAHRQHIALIIERALDT
ncbi:MAG: hypothetical protein GXP16_05715, partial [Gammaproteobacteria bacterium]|nr:hypothetical protein [Gammaproteobacteria bacterium]